MFSNGAVVELVTIAGPLPVHRVDGRAAQACPSRADRVACTHRIGGFHEWGKPLRNLKVHSVDTSVPLMSPLLASHSELSDHFSTSRFSPSRRPFYQCGKPRELGGKGGQCPETWSVILSPLRVDVDDDHSPMHLSASRRSPYCVLCVSLSLSAPTLCVACSLA